MSYHTPVEEIVRRNTDAEQAWRDSERFPTTEKKKTQSPKPAPVVAATRLIVYGNGFAWTNVVVPGSTVGKRTLELPNTVVESSIRVTGADSGRAGAVKYYAFLSSPGDPLAYGGEFVKDNAGKTVSILTRTKSKGGHDERIQGVFLGVTPDGQPIVANDHGDITIVRQDVVALTIKGAAGKDLLGSSPRLTWLLANPAGHTHVRYLMRQVTWGFVHEVIVGTEGTAQIRTFGRITNGSGQTLVLAPGSQLVLAAGDLGWVDDRVRTQQERAPSMTMRSLRAPSSQGDDEAVLQVQEDATGTYEEYVFASPQVEGLNIRHGETVHLMDSENRVTADKLLIFDHAAHGENVGVMVSMVTTELKDVPPGELIVYEATSELGGGDPKGERLLGSNRFTPKALLSPTLDMHLGYTTTMIVRRKVTATDINVRSEDTQRRITTISIRVTVRNIGHRAEHLEIWERGPRERWELQPVTPSLGEAHVKPLTEPSASDQIIFFAINVPPTTKGAPDSVVEYRSVITEY